MDHKVVVRLEGQGQHKAQALSNSSNSRIVVVHPY
jgi:hypothetical protein